MLTIAPPLAVLIIAGIACFESRNIVSTLTCMTRRYCSGFSSTTLPRLPMPTLLSRKSSRPQRSTAASTSRLQSASLVTSPAMRRGRAAFGRDHLDGAFGELEVAVGDQHLGAGARQQDRRRAAVADAVTCRAAAARSSRPCRRGRHRPRVPASRFFPLCADDSNAAARKRRPVTSGHRRGCRARSFRGCGISGALLAVIASEAKQSIPPRRKYGLLRR